MLAGRKRIAVQMATGAGKTNIFIEMASRAAEKGGRVLVLTRRVGIVYQTASRFPFPVSVTVGGKRKAPLGGVEIASIDTVVRRPSFPGILPDIVIIDEAHDTSSNGYRKVMGKLEGAFFVGFSATMYPVGGGDHSWWETALCPVSPSELLAGGWLCPARVMVPEIPDLSGIRIVRGDYAPGALEQAVSESTVLDGAVRRWKSLAGGRRTICFGATIYHSKLLAKSFVEAGVPAVHCDGGDNMEARTAALKGLVDGTIKIVCNVNIFSTGTDVPGIECIIMARPTQSMVLYVQQIGRGLRPSPGKKDLLVLDLAGNALRFGLPYDDRPPDISKHLGAKAAPSASLISICGSCFSAFPPGKSKCPACGYSPPPPKNEPKKTSGRLAEYDRRMAIRQDFKFLMTKLGSGKAPYRALLTKYGEEARKHIRFPVK